MKECPNCKILHKNKTFCSRKCCCVYLNRNINNLSEKIKKRKNTIKRLGLLSGINNPMYGKKRPDLSARNNTMKNKTYKEMYGDERAQKIKKKISRPGKLNSNYGVKLWDKYPHPKGMLGKTHSEKYKKRLSVEMSGSGNPSWNNGKSFEIYPKDFWLIRKKILERDCHSCQLCNAKQKLDVHHINYNKQDNRPYNLITLCKKCHGKISGNSGRKKQYILKSWKWFFAKERMNHMFRYKLIPMNNSHWSEKQKLEV